MSLSVTTPNTDYAKATTNINSAIATLTYPFAMSFFIYNSSATYPRTLQYIRSGGNTSMFTKINVVGPSIAGYHYDGATSQGGFQSSVPYHQVSQWEHYLILWIAVNTVSKIYKDAADLGVSADATAGTTLGTIDELGAALSLGPGKCALYGLYAGATTFTADERDLLAGTNRNGGNILNKIYSPKLIHTSECKHAWSFDHVVHGSGWLNDLVGSATMVLQGSATFDDAQHPSAGGIVYSGTTSGPILLLEELEG
jgi:hypothetical protein